MRCGEDDAGTTPAREIEKQVVARTEAMTSTYEAQSKFIADISHELQTPIAILRGNVEILERHVAPEAKGLATRYHGNARQHGASRRQRPRKREIKIL